MHVHVGNIYRNVLAAERLPQGVGVVSLAQLALAFSGMVTRLRAQRVSAEEQGAFRSAIAHAVDTARHLTVAERVAVQNTLSTAFDGLPRDTSSLQVRADFLRQVTFHSTLIPPVRPT
jgi:hypothetical protein